MLNVMYKPLNIFTLEINLKRYTQKFPGVVENKTET